MYEYSATITNIVDGDTVDAIVDLGYSVTIKSRLRLARINCPEVSTPEGMASKAFTTTWLPVGSAVTIKTSKDKREKWGRMLAEVTLGTTNINDLLVTSNMAKYVTY